jgi:hypothetical protein
MPVVEARRLNLPSIFGVQPLHALVEDEALDLSVVPSDFAQTTKTSAMGELVIQFFAPTGDSRHRPSGPGDHAAGIGAVVRLGQAEAADPLARWRASAGTSLFCSSVP